MRRYIILAAMAALAASCTIADGNMERKPIDVGKSIAREADRRLDNTNGAICWALAADEYLSTEDMIAANDETLTTLPAFLIPGNDYWYYGAGVEYLPVESVRLHAVWASNNYTSHHTINIGATWRFNITNAIKRIACKQ